MKTSHVSRLQKLENKIKARRSDRLLAVEEAQDQPGVFMSIDKKRTYTQEELDSYNGTILKIVRIQAPLPGDKDQA